MQILANKYNCFTILIVKCFVQEMDDSFNKSLVNFEKNFTSLLLKFIHTITNIIRNEKSQKIEDIRYKLIYKFVFYTNFNNCQKERYITHFLYDVINNMYLHNKCNFYNYILNSI